MHQGPRLGLLYPLGPSPLPGVCPEPPTASCSTQEIAGQQGSAGSDPSGLGPWNAPPPFYWSSWKSLCHFQMRGH